MYFLSEIFFYIAFEALLLTPEHADVLQVPALSTQSLVALHLLLGQIYHFSALQKSSISDGSQISMPLIRLFSSAPHTHYL